MINLKDIDFVKPMPENMNIMSMTVEDFKAVHIRNVDDDLSDVQSVVILPTEEIHDSGFMLMNLVVVNSDFRPICRTLNNDVVCLDGLLGSGKGNGFLENVIPVKGWRIDCLPCGLVRIFSDYRLELEHTGSPAISVYSIKEEE